MQQEAMIGGIIPSWLGVLVIGATLPAITSNSAEAAVADGGSATVVIRGANSETEQSLPFGNGAPAVLRGSPPHPTPAPERSACGNGYYYDPSRGCVASADVYTGDYAYWPSYGWGWPSFGLQHRQPRRGISRYRFPGHAIPTAPHPIFGIGRAAPHSSGFAHR